MAHVDRSFIGEAEIFVRPFGTAGALQSIGNCDTFNIGYNVDSRKLPNFMGGGGNRNVSEKVSDVTVAIGMYDVTPENLARVTKAAVSNYAAGIVNAEPIACAGVEGELIPFKYLPDLTQPVTISTADDVALAEGQDYILGPHGIFPTGDSGITSAGIKATYTRKGASVVEMLAGSQVELELFVAGLNDAQSGEPYALRAHRCKFGLIKELGLIGTSYMKLDSQGELLADHRVTEVGISKFCKMDLM